MSGLRRETGERDLMCAKRPFDRFTIDGLRSGPPLRRAENDHRPPRARANALGTCFGLYLPNFGDHGVERSGHREMRRSRLVALNEMRDIAVAAKQVLELLPRDPSEYGGTGNLVTVEMQDREHHTIQNRIEKFVRVPAGRQRPGFGFPITDDARDHQLRIVERGTVRVCERITELASL